MQLTIKLALYGTADAAPETDAMTEVMVAAADLFNLVLQDVDAWVTEGQPFSLWFVRDDIEGAEGAYDLFVIARTDEEAVSLWRQEFDLDEDHIPSPGAMVLPNPDSDPKPRIVGWDELAGQPPAALVAEAEEAKAPAPTDEAEGWTSRAALLRRAIEEWPQFDAEDEVNGGDMVEWFGEFREEAKAVLERSVQGELPEDLKDYVRKLLIARDLELRTLLRSADTTPEESAKAMGERQIIRRCLTDPTLN